MSSTYDPSPHPKGMQSFWRNSPGHLDNFKSAEKVPSEIDIVVIGAGFSGAAIVTHLLRNPTYPWQTPSILVLEARQLCSGATGRNGGHLKPDSYALISTLADKYGVDAAAEVAEFEAANVRAVTDFIREEEIDCDFVLTRAVDVQLNDELQGVLERRYHGLIAAGVEATRSTFCAPRKDAEQLSGVKGAKGMFSYTAGHVWPYKLIHNLFASAISKGVHLHTHTPASSISQNTDGTWTVYTSHGTTRAKKVIVVANAYTSSLLPEYKDKIIPYRGVVAHIKTPGPAPFLPNTYSLRFADWDFDYLIPRPDGSIIVGGARQAYLRDEKEWYGNTDDSTVIESTRKYFDGYMQRHFLGWEKSGAYTADLWTGIMGYSADRLPRVGAVPGRDGVFIMGGFTGHGMPQVFLCAKGIADMVLGDVEFRHSGVPRLFEETEARLSDNRNAVDDIRRGASREAKL
ncbi:FAD dependent oxidoreductase [Sarocladium strictum]